MSRRDKKGGRKGKGKFAYKSRDKEAAQERATGGGGDFDSILISDITTYTAGDGDNLIRFLPPTWDDPEHYGYDIFVHYGIGPDRSAYLCRKKMLNEACPICEERARASKDGDDDYAKELEPKQRVLVYLLDRDKEDEGVKAWASPWGFDRDICKISVDKRTGEVLELDHPEEGYDVEFERNGKGIKTKYEGVKIARRESELDNDEALEFVTENPLPDILNFFDYDHIADVFNGGDGDSSGKEEEDDDKPAKKKGKKGKKSEEDKPDYDYDELSDLNHRKLKKLGEELDLDEDDVDFDDEDELFEAICEDLGVEIPTEEEEEEEEEEKPRKKSKKSKKDDKKTTYTWADIHDDFTRSDLEDLAATRDLDEDDVEDMDDDELADAICESLDLEEPRKKNKKGKKAKDEDEDEDDDDKPAKKKGNKKLAALKRKRNR